MNMILSRYDHLKDLTNIQHPMPVLYTRSALIHIQSGEILKIVLNNPESAHDIHKICQYSGHYVLKCIESENNQAFWIKKN